MPGASHQHEVARWLGAPLRRLGVATGLVCLLALSGVPGARAAVWAQQTVPAPSGLTYPLAGSFDAVSCPAVNDCVAAGSQTLQDGQTTEAAETWNGASWSIHSIADPTNVLGIDGVSCASTTACMVVGEGTANDFAESWNGSAWSPVATPTPGPSVGNAGSAELSISPGSVSCVAADACVAVGSVEVGNASTAPYAARWNGATWTREQPPQPALPPPQPGYVNSGRLNAVSCASATACTAVGEVSAGGGDTTAFVDEWNGSTWSLVTVPPPAAAGVQYASLDAVSCATSSSCVAVGVYSATEEGLPYSEVWNGTTWSSPIMQGVGVSDNTDSVSCTSPTACAALLPGPGNGGLVEEWNGASWSTQSIVSLTERPTVSDLSCASTVSCMLVGTNNDSDTASPLAELRQPSGWSLAPAPLTAPDSISLDAVSCTSRTACTGVGSPSHGGVVVERWNGRDWRLQSAPSPAGAAVTAVSCASARTCMLVGFQDTGMLTERWNGRTWSLETIGGPESVDGVPVDGLNAVSCTSASACIAVGGESEGEDIGVPALGERWNGRDWSSERMPLPAAQSSSTLTGVSCRSRHRCVAVGTYYISPTSRGPDLARTLAEGWNGSRWSLQAPSQRTRLSALSCPSTKNCNAIAQHWNGRSWSVGPNPNAVLNSISCVTAHACTAVGSGRIEHWDGSLWKRQPAARGLPVARFNAVSCVSTRTCVLVGSRPNAAGVRVPLIERHS